MASGSHDSDGNNDTAELDDSTRATEQLDSQEEQYRGVGSCFPLWLRDACLPYNTIQNTLVDQELGTMG